MKSFEATAVSLRVGQIRLDDIAPQVGDAMSAEVIVVDLGGTVQHVPLTFTTKWSSRGWCRVFQCSRCHAPAQILQVEDNAGLCGSLRGQTRDLPIFAAARTERPTAYGSCPVLWFAKA